MIGGEEVGGLLLCSQNAHDQNVPAREGAHLGAPGVGG